MVCDLRANSQKLNKTTTAKAVAFSRAKNCQKYLPLAYFSAKEKSVYSIFLSRKIPAIGPKPNF